MANTCFLYHVILIRNNRMCYALGAVWKIEESELNQQNSDSGPGKQRREKKHPACHTWRRFCETIWAYHWAFSGLLSGDALASLFFPAAAPLLRVPSVLLSIHIVLCPYFTLAYHLCNIYFSNKAYPKGKKVTPIRRMAGHFFLWRRLVFYQVRN